MEVSAGEGRKLGGQARDAVMACVCGADSRTAVPGWVFPEAWLNPAWAMTSRPSADEGCSKDDSGTESPRMLYSSASRSETHSRPNSISSTPTRIWGVSALVPALRISLVSSEGWTEVRAYEASAAGLAMP